MSNDMVAGAYGSIVERFSKDKDIDLVKFNALLDRFDKERRETQEEAFNRDMALFQNEVTPPDWSGRNPMFNNPYAKLEDLDRVARPIYSKYGFSVRFGSEANPNVGWQTTTITVSHREGWKITEKMPGPTDVQATESGRRSRTPIQAVMSTNTYLMRTLFRMVFGLIAKGDPSDDDGEATRVERPPVTPPTSTIRPYNQRREDNASSGQTEPERR